MIPFQRHIREHADAHRAGQVKEGSECPGNDPALNFFRPDSGCLQQYVDTGADGAFCQLDLMHILARDHNVPANPRITGFNQHKLRVVVCQAHPFVFPVHSPTPVNDMRIQQFSDAAQDACTADTHRWHPADGGYMDISILDAHFFNGAGRSPHTILDMRTFESRTGCGGTGKDPPAVNQADLGIGADIHQYHPLVFCFRINTQQCRGVVTADIPGYVSRCVQERTIRQRQPNLTRQNIKRLCHCRYIRRSSQLPDRQPAEEMVHGGVSHQHCIHHLAAHNPRFGTHASNGLVERFHQAGLQQRLVVDPLVGKSNPADNIFTECNLGVHHPGFGYSDAAGKVNQVQGQFGRAHIHSQPVQRCSGR